MNYNYSISTQTLNGKVALDSLKEDILTSSIIFAIDNITQSDDDLSISFKANLSSGEEAILNTIVSQHDGNPIEEDNTVHYVEDLPQGGRRVTDRGFQFTALAGQETVFDFQVTEDLFVKEGFAIGYDFDKTDTVSMSIVHPLMPTQSLHDYLREMPLEPHVADKTIGKVTATNKAITETNFNGLIIRMKYQSNGTSDVHVAVTMRTYS